MTDLPAGIDPSVPPSGTGCAQCLAGEGAGWWIHLRRCAQCGNIGCCDTSMSQHATSHSPESPTIPTFREPIRERRHGNHKQLETE